MRTEKEMMDFILKVAADDERVRVVTLEGSRTNPNVPRDFFQDYDISFHVTEMDSFLQNPGWVDMFGERIIMQTPEAMAMFPPELGRRFSYLMLFTDGNRIDLTLIPLDEKDEYCKEDKLMMVLMDKDNCFPKVLPPTDEDYWVKRPSAAYFYDCCNEFWWVSTYVAKGLWRKEFLFAQDHLNQFVRPMLIKMLEWQVGIQTDFSVSVGKNGKYLDTYLSEKTWQELMSTYENGTYEGVWRSLFTMGALFRRTAQDVARHLKFEYPLEEDRRVTDYLKRVQNLPRNATAFI
ncbi:MULTISPECIES: aminoglycoside 6-adenylyltransferase [Brevibacillus]|jgi:aminoglycoside 6-adenylyltransferase|uniref:aminoglycoside 6-adenylyltransferase n=1 Tax=Brevibacillus TaxID=55080 RepID=UPI0004682FEF|nr:aminoglycoside 6-adenylyltransferase [Brevibacillus borstelensis]KKX53736.1 aminoglycoside adenylyltransferase [Brevibacillus borstelensis cifa_chp40]MBE5396423.1 aminoglycoside 6-adenylyltransferase [Brevibacillus borstelensis]MCC0566916.1 aminoglycoside 6-adenylyltransferase [Brevibacillus borstelensis]MCM3470697.1 aminoglycoside 6-adenylyltransferase [Brevibacillus borstelensis]MCM3558961.1 aminoglycoside 6-adenylyltransferase [Brevibacillus borstelensis]